MYSFEFDVTEKTSTEVTVYNCYDMPLTTEHEKCTKGRKYMYNIPVMFDIESTTIPNEDLQKSYAYMYQWQICIDKTVCFGRTWKEFVILINRIIDEMDTPNHNLVIYVHNLPYEWAFMNQFLKQIDDNIKAFYVKKRMPLAVRMPNIGLEFRCSWKLSNMSLEKFVENSGSFYRKQTHIDYDYSKIRTPLTPLTNDELGYCYCDVRGGCDAIRAELEHGYTLADIPLTSTGFVRRDTQKAYRYYDNWCNGKFISAEYSRIFKRLPYHPKRKKGKEYHYRFEFIQDALTPELYTLFKDISRGGDTKANALHAGKIRNNVYSFDRVSSYPAVQMTYKYPSGKWVNYFPTDENMLREYLYDDEKCCICTLYLENIRLKKGASAPYIPTAKCKTFVKGKKGVEDNGKIMIAEKLSISITEIDFRIIDDLYDFDIVEWENVYRCKKDYLPVPLRAVNLLYFLGKCELKNVDAFRYMKSKNKLNGIFGMTFTDLIHELWTFDLNDLKWEVDKAETDNEIREALEKYYNDKKSCLRYDTGVYTTAYARYELYLAIKAVGRKAFMYADTDSVKWFSDNPKEVSRILKWFNGRNEELIAKALECEAYVDYNGKRYILGVWENESKDGGPLYSRFITYGAKKYAYEYTEKNILVDKDGVAHPFGITVAGLSKTKGEKFFRNCDNFKLGVTVPEDMSGRTIGVWRDERIHTVTIQGVGIETAGSCAILDTTYTLGVKGEYNDLMYNGQLYFN